MQNFFGKQKNCGGMKNESIFYKPLQEYPIIKCNVATGIYHLPMDQHYDNFEVKPEREDCYVMTVQEAEEIGCRRAWKWHKKQ